MPRVLLALGSNLGDRGAILETALAEIDNLDSTQVESRSTWHSTRPVGGPAGQGEFLNGAVVIETQLPPADLRRELYQIEQRLGRKRAERWAARTLDIDILLYADLIIAEPDLQIPHPRMSFRPFVLAPAVEIAPTFGHPALGVTIGALWHHLQHGEDLVVICGGLADDRQRLREDLLCQFSPHSFAEHAESPSQQANVVPALRVRKQTLAPESLRKDEIQVAEGSALPKLQIHFNLPKDEFANYLTARGSSLDHQLWHRLQEQLGVPNSLNQLFSGIPTLVLDPRDDPAQQLTEATAALEAVWPDLCRTGA